MARRAGQAIDDELVEQVKALHKIGHTQKFIAKTTGLSMSTVQRYIKRPDETPAVVAERDRQFEDFVRKAWMAIQDYMDIILSSARDEDGKLRTDISPKDAAWITGVLFDKIATREANLRRPLEKPANYTFTFISTRDNATADSRPVSDTIEIPPIGEPVPGDDMRPGGGKDLLRLPGGCEDVT